MLIIQRCWKVFSTSTYLNSTQIHISAKLLDGIFHQIFNWLLSVCLMIFELKRFDFLSIIEIVKRSIETVTLSKSILEVFQSYRFEIFQQTPNHQLSNQSKLLKEMFLEFFCKSFRCPLTKRIATPKKGFRCHHFFHNAVLITRIIKLSINFTNTVTKLWIRMWFGYLILLLSISLWFLLLFSLHFSSF